MKKTALFSTLALSATLASTNAAVILATDFSEVITNSTANTATGITWDTVDGIDTPASQIEFTSALRGDNGARVNVNQKVSGTSAAPWTGTIDFQVSASTGSIDLTNFSLNWEALNSSGGQNSPTKNTLWTFEVFNRSGAVLGSSLGTASINDAWTSTEQSSPDNSSLFNLDISGLSSLTGGSEYQLQFTATDGGSPGHYIAFDDFKLEGDITPIPEPSTTALLGLAGLALILRRRK